MFRLLLVAVPLVASACKKDAPAGLPPSTDWQAGGSAAPEKPQGTPKAGNPHGGADPHAGVPGAPAMGGTDPHAGVPGAPPVGGDPHGGSAGRAPDVTPAKVPPKELEKTADGRVVLGPFTLAAPKEWTYKPSTSSMRAAQWVWSDKSGEQAELVVFYFGEGGAGGVQANLDRWLGQITPADGKPAKDVAKIEKTKVAGQEATTVQVAGRLTTQQMPGGPPPVDMADAMLLAAIVNSPLGPYYFKGTGSKKTVEANAAKFKAMLASMKLK
jgi:hypothetical protein